MKEYGPPKTIVIEDSSTKDEYYRIKLTNTEVELIERRITGQGGMQDLMWLLQKRYKEASKTLRLSTSDIEKIKRYYYRYGKAGGFQARLAPIVRHICNELDPSATKLDSFFCGSLVCEDCNNDKDIQIL